MSIPKIIWQTHEWEYEDLPINFKRSMQTWKNLNPDWEHKYHSAIDRANAVKDFDRELYQYYMFSDKVTQSDIWRYVVTYQYGGFYVDMDSYCISPLDYFISSNNLNDKELFCSEILKSVITKENDPNRYIFESVNNAYFGVKKESFIIKEIINNIKEKHKNLGSILFVYNDIEEQSGILTRITPKYLWLGPEIFYPTILKYRDKTLFNFNGAIHSKDIKESFSGTFEVNYYGNKKDYLELCKDMNWEDV